MRSALSELEVIRPPSLAHALRALKAGNGERPVPLAGGTDLLVYLNAGTPPGRRFLDLWGLGELRGIRAARAGVTIGALTTFREIRAHPVIRKRLPSLAAAAAEIGALQIQNRATLGGNIANASPAGDSLPVLMAHDAVVVAVPRQSARLTGFGGQPPIGQAIWGDTWVSLGRPGLEGVYTDRFTGQRLTTGLRDGVPILPVSSLFGFFPVALLKREENP